MFERFDEPVSGCVWAPDGQTIILGSFDKDRSLCQWNLDGDRIYSWTKKHRTEDLALSPDGQWLVAMDDRQFLHVYNFVTRKLEYDLPLEARPSSVSISADSGFILVNKQDGEILLYSILAPGHLVRKYTGHTGGKYLIRSAFGGAHESFIISGSEGSSFAPSTPAPRCRTDVVDARWQRGDLAQEHRGPDVQAQRPPTAMQCHFVEPCRSVHVRLVWRRQQDQDVRCLPGDWRARRCRD